MQGQIPGLIRRLAEHPFFADRIRFTTNRRENNNVATKLLLLEFRGKFVDTKKIQIDRFVQEGIRAENPGFETAADRVEAVLDRMLAVFNPRDSLLKSEGPVPLYYWLVRNTPDAFLQYIREFIVRFEDDRVTNRRKAAQDISPDDDLLEFDRLRRSINDQGSLSGMYDILEQRLSRFLIARGVDLQTAKVG